MQPFNTLTAELVGGPRDGERITVIDPSTRRLELSDPSVWPDPLNDDDILTVATDTTNRLIYIRGDNEKWTHQNDGVYHARFNYTTPTE